MENHVLDIVEDKELDLFAEELPQQVQLLSDCFSTASSGVCGLSCMGSVISSGASK